MSVSVERKVLIGESLKPEECNALFTYSALKFLAATSSNSFSERAITAVARQFPITFTEVRAISISTSIPRIIKIGSTGKPKLTTVPSRITREALETPATPLLVSIRVKQITNLFFNGKVNACSLRNKN